MNSIILAGHGYNIAPPPFGVLRKLIASLNRMAQEPGNSETAMNESAVLFCFTSW